MSRPWPPPANEIPLMPVDVLALELLRYLDFHDNRPYSRRTLLGTNGRIPSLGHDYGTPAVLRAVNEAWDWLFINGLMAGSPNQDVGFREITRRGEALTNSPHALRAIDAQRLLAVTLHPSIEARARSLFLLGEYESAVLSCFREVEIRVRHLGGYSQDDIGVTLMKNAFSVERGPLTDLSLPRGEREAVMFLFAGAFGAFRNPAGHRQVDHDDPAIAAETVLLADLLMRILDGVESRLLASQRGS